MLWQCCGCARKIDDQEDDYEAMEVTNERGTVWYYFHPSCIDDVRSQERRLSAMGKTPKQTLPKKISSIKGSWSGQAVL